MMWDDRRRRRWSRTNRLIAEAAERMGARAEELCDVHSDILVRLVHGDRSVIIAKTRSPHLSAVSGVLANNKYASGELLKAAGVPVVPRVLVEDLTDAAQARTASEALARWGTVVVKPNWRNRALGVVTRIEAPELMRDAVALAVGVDVDGEALIEPYVGGKSLRVTVIGGRVAAACTIDHVCLRGDGNRTVQQLIDALNADPRRGWYDEGALTPLDCFEPDATWRATLALRGLDLASPLPEGRVLDVVSEEAETTDVTDVLAPRWAAVAEQACRVLGVDVGGVDLIVDDPSGDEGVVLEVNCLPALHLHAMPTRGVARPVFDAFVAWCLKR